MPWFTFHLNDFAYSFLSVLFEGVPFLLLGSLISGLVDVFVSAERMQRLLPANRAAAICISGLLGLIFPMCECGSVIVIRRFIRKGLPLSVAVTYMLAAPIVSPLVAISTFAAFRGQNPPGAVHIDATGFMKWYFDHEGSITMTLLRLTIGYLVAIAVGFIVHRIPSSALLRPEMLAATPARRRAGLSISAAPAEPQDFSAIVAAASTPKKLLIAVQSATSDFLEVACFFVIGTAIASVFNTAVDQTVIQPLATNPPRAIAALMGLAIILSVCSTTDAFIAASFKAFPFAAKLGFLLFGPVFDLKLFWLYGILFKRRFVVLLGLGLFLLIWLICWRVAALQL